MSNIITLLAQGLCWELGKKDWFDLVPPDQEAWRVRAKDAIIALGLSKPEIEELDAYRTAAIYDVMMSGLRFAGWNRSQLDRARKLTQDNAVINAKGEDNAAEQRAG